MDQADRFDHDHARGGPEGREAAPPAPIVIVQRGRSAWGRELLLLVLLLSTAGYIFYREYRGPAYFIRDEDRRAARLVDAIEVAPIADGAVVLRASGSGPGLDDPVVKPVEPPPADRSVTVAASPDDLPSPAGGIDSGTIAGPASDATGDDLASNGPDGDPPPIAGDDFPAGEPIGQDEAAPPDPHRMSSEILFDRDPRLPPPPETVAEEPAEPREPERRQVADLPEPRKTPAPTLDQRRHFLKLLSFATRQHGLRAGPVIDGLCRDFGTALPPGLGLQEQQLAAMIAGSELERTITGLRQIGMPEPYLLDLISAQMNRAIGVRHGPRDRMEARVFAARKLLAVPLVDVRDDRR